ncbi:Chitin-binding type-4 domain-containing protein [Pseudozyma hubeiensis]|nr:Chitin-binding type-4 domain-containing protein [Pseudozyma hubeiensis]
MSSRNSSASISLFRLVALVATLSSLLVAMVDAHGYITSPASRSYMCKQGSAKDCGEIQYEPQSVEAPKGLPFNRSGDGKLCSAGLSQFSPLDRQGKSVWPTTKANNVKSFSWAFTAMHATTDFKYYITKANWDSSKTGGLSSSDFESSPFLTVPMGGKPPSASMTHDLSNALPSRSGYHVVYAVWTVSNTGNAFYQCMDLDFAGGNSNVGAGSSPSASPQAPSATSTAVSPSGTASGNSPASPSSGSGPSTPNDDNGDDSGDDSNDDSSDDTSNGSGNASSSAINGNSGASAPKPKSHASHGSSCRLKKQRRAPSASVLAARGDYRRHKAHMRRAQHV